MHTRRARAGAAGALARAGLDNGESAEILKEFGYDTAPENPVGVLQNNGMTVTTLMDIVVLILLSLFPVLSLWLPKLMGLYGK